jgi:hypothetical protein
MFDKIEQMINENFEDVNIFEDSLLKIEEKCTIDKTFEKFILYFTSKKGSHMALITLTVYRDKMNCSLQMDYFDRKHMTNIKHYKSTMEFLAGGI